MMPRTIYLPSDLIDTQALSFARTVTSKGCVLAAIELPADDSGLVTPGALGLARSDDGVVCLFAGSSPVFVTGVFMLTDVVGLDCTTVFGGAPAIVPAVSVFVALESGGAEGVATSDGLDAAGVLAAGAVVAPDPLA